MIQNGILLKLAVNLALVIITIVFGIIMHKSGKPYSALIFTVHKLATVAFVVYTSLVISHIIKHYNEGVLFWVLLVLALLLLIVLLVSGALVSLDKNSATMAFIHTASTWLFLADIIGLFITIIILK